MYRKYLLPIQSLSFRFLLKEVQFYVATIKNFILLLCLNVFLHLIFPYFLLNILKFSSDT